MKPPLVISCVAIVFFLFKAGFVRADRHAYFFYGPIMPIMFLIYAVLAAKLTKYQTITMSLCLLFSLAAYWHHLNVFRSSLCGQIATDFRMWVDTPQRLRLGVNILRHGFTDEGRMRSELMSKFPNLFRTLTALCAAKGPRPLTITFMPWELMFAHCVPNCRFVPIPSLQIYAESILFHNKELVTEFLRSETAPDIIVLGDNAIDHRNSVSELTNWLPLLCAHYKVFDRQDGYTILRRAGETADNTRFVCDEKGPGQFLAIRLDPLNVKHPLLHKVASALFKAPELEVRVNFRNAYGESKRIVARGFRSQLVNGVYLSNNPVGKLITGLLGDKPIDAEYVISEVVSAQVVRKDGYRNLPVFPSDAPLEVQVCRCKSFTSYKTTKSLSERFNESNERWFHNSSSLKSRDYRISACTFDGNRVLTSSEEIR
jgi:hypothetical protein